MGTALAQLVCWNTAEVCIYARRKEVVDSINLNRVNLDYFPTLRLGENIRARSLSELSLSCDADVLIVAVPSGSAREVAKNLGELPRDSTLVSVAKGIEYPSMKTISQVIAEETGIRNVAALSGPTFADEIAFNRTAGATLGIPDENLVPILKRTFDGLILDFSGDVRAVELCGVLKNVYAIAAGIWDSALGSHNDHYAFVNLCFKETGNILGAISFDEEITMKFCCFGDLSLTCNVDKSRNRTLGLMIGKQLIRANGFVTDIVMEGIKSAKSIEALVTQYGIHAPIARFVSRVLEGKEDIDAGISRILREATMLE